jgi:hypothetical protein
MHYIHYKRWLVLIILQLAIPAKILLAQNWRGTINSDWNNAANWSAWPLTNTNLVIDPINYTGIAASPAITNASVFIPSKILMQNGAQLTIQNNLTTNDNFDVIGTGSLLSIMGGTVNIGLSNNGRLLADIGGAILINNGTITTGKSLAAGSASTISMNNGTVNTLQRLLIDMGGSFLFNNGNITVGQRVAIGDGDVYHSSLFQMNGGNLTIGAELNLSNEFGNFTPCFNMTGGTLVVNGIVSWLGIAPGAGAPLFNISGGNCTINGNIINTVASTVNMNLQINGTGQLNFNGSLIETLYPSDSIQQKNNSRFFFNNNSNWVMNGVFTATNSLTTFNDSTTLQGNGQYSFDGILINSGKSLVHTNPYNIDIKGNFTNHGNFVSSSNSVTFNGSNAQVIDGSIISRFNKVIISNVSPAGVSTNKSFWVTGQ